MGVELLTEFVESWPAVWDRDFKLQKTRLVIDGVGLLGHLHQRCGPGGKLSDTRCGGQYNDFYSFTCKFFNELKEDNVQPLVVLDGVKSRNKEANTKIRAERQAKNLEKVAECTKGAAQVEAMAKVHDLPIWARMVFLEALTYCEVPVLRANGEADDVIAAIAYCYRSPVLTTDSDFFIYDLPGGVLRLSDNINYQNPCAALPLFRRSMFISALVENYLSNYTVAQVKDVLPLAATLSGNDYYTAGGGDRGSCALVETLRWLLKDVQPNSNGVEKLSGHPQYVPHLAIIQSSVDTYTLSPDQCKTDTEHYFSPQFLSKPPSTKELRCDPPTHYPDWLTEAFHLGSVVRPNALYGWELKDKAGLGLDSPRHAPISDLDRPLRCITLALLSSPVVTEIVRRQNSSSVNECRLEAALAVPGYAGPTLGLKVVAELSLEERRRFFLLASESWTDLVKELTPARQFLVASLRYLWKQMLANRHMPAISPQHIAVLLVGIVDGCDGDCEAQVKDVKTVLDSQKDNLLTWRGGTQPAPKLKPPPPATASHTPTQRYDAPVDCTVMHVFNGWQRVVRSLMEINCLLKWPMGLLYVHRLYDGVRNCKMYGNGRVKSANVKLDKVTHKLWDAVVEGKDTWTQPTPGTDST